MVVDHVQKRKLTLRMTSLIQTFELLGTIDKICFEDFKKLIIDLNIQQKGHSICDVSLIVLSEDKIVIFIKCGGHRYHFPGNLINH